MAEVLCRRHTLEDITGHVYAWRVVPQSVEHVQWPDALRARADMEGWITKVSTEAFWHNYGDDVPETEAATWQAIAADLYKMLARLMDGADMTEDDHFRALRVMALYDAEVDWAKDDKEPPRKIVKMPEQAESYLG